VTDYAETNRKTWDVWTGIHLKSDFYDVASFKEGATSLKEIELGEVGDVEGKSLLHLQCHFGMDTISWARLGARATGLDFSKKAIEAARTLAAEVGVEARFVCADVHDTPEVIDERFDIVFTSYGVLWWLPDLKLWGEVVAGMLAPGGRFYMAELHPVLMALGDDGSGLAYPYFTGSEPERIEDSGTYAAPDDPVKTLHYGWNHPLAEVVQALLDAGVSLRFLL